MKKKSRKTSQKPLLQTFEAVPITDPAVQAALDCLFTQAKPVIPPILREYAKTKSRNKK